MAMIHNTAASQSEDEATAARKLWDQQFDSRQIRLDIDEPAPFQRLHRLGGGGVGIVYATNLGNIALALKTTYPRRLTEQQLNEIKILGRISEQRHRHVVELVGSYIHRQKIGYELGLLIWPVAQCDLASFMQDILTYKEFRIWEDFPEDNDCKASVENLKATLGLSNGARTWYVQKVVIDRQITRRLTESFGCIANAIDFLHSNNIRHKDLKPSQILLSRNGLWLTDFGWSNDMSECSQSITSNGDIINLRYQSPERARKLPCGRSEDIFALGCIFMEITASIVPHGSFSYWKWNRNWLWSREKPVRYQEVLPQIHDQLSSAVEDPSTPIAYFLRMLKEMMNESPSTRPNTTEIIQTLEEFDDLPSIKKHIWFFGSCSFFGPCCRSQHVSHVS